MCAFGQTIALVGWSAYVNGKHGPIQRYLQQILTWKNFVVYALINAIREELYSRVLVFGTFLLYAEHLRNDDDKTAWMVVVVFANVLQAVQSSLMHVGGGFPSGWWPGGVLVFIWALLLVTMRLWAGGLLHVLLLHWLADIVIFVLVLVRRDQNKKKGRRGKKKLG